jgi:hypothetical protein
MCAAKLISCHCESIATCSSVKVLPRAFRSWLEQPSASKSEGPFPRQHRHGFIFDRTKHLPESRYRETVEKAATRAHLEGTKTCVNHGIVHGGSERGQEFWKEKIGNIITMARDRPASYLAPFDTVAAASFAVAASTLFAPGTAGAATASFASDSLVPATDDLSAALLVVLLFASSYVSKQ